MRLTLDQMRGEVAATSYALAAWPHMQAEHDDIVLMLDRAALAEICDPEPGEKLPFIDWNQLLEDLANA
jgi:hypothetical protein